MATATASSPAAVDPLQIGPRVRALREAMGLSLRDLGERAGVSAPMLSPVERGAPRPTPARGGGAGVSAPVLSRAERGETSPTLATAQRIATGLELSLSQLLRLDE